MPVVIGTRLATSIAHLREDDWMDTLRTPEDRFAQLPGFDHVPRYGQVPDGEGGELRMAYVEAGPADGPVVLLLHGEPTWSFLYRDGFESDAAPLVDPPLGRGDGRPRHLRAERGCAVLRDHPLLPPLPVAVHRHRRRFYQAAAPRSRVKDGGHR